MATQLGDENVSLSEEEEESEHGPQHSQNASDMGEESDNILDENIPANQVIEEEKEEEEETATTPFFEDNAVFSKLFLFFLYLYIFR